MYLRTLPQALVLLTILMSLAVTPAQVKTTGEVDVAKCWTCTLGNGERFVSDGTRIFVGGAGARVDALSLDGKKMWSAELGGEINSNLLPLDNALFVVTSPVSAEGAAAGESRLRGVSKETGITVWTVKVPDADLHFLGAANGDLWVVSGSGTILSIDPKTGAAKWRREIADGFALEPVLFGDKMFLISTAKQLFTIALVSGEIESMTKLSSGATARAIAGNGDLVVGDERGSVISLEDGQKTNWKFKTGGSISAILPVGDGLLVASHDNFVYFLTGRNGGLAWKKRLSARPFQIGTVGSEYAIVSGIEERGATLIALSSGKVSGQVAFGTEETLVAKPVTADGKILFLTSEAVRAYSVNGCPQKQMAMTGK